MPKFAINTRTQNPQEVLDRMNRHPQRKALSADLEGMIKSVIFDMTTRGETKDEITTKVQTLILVYGETF
jgi:hypothetical protein